LAPPLGLFLFIDNVFIFAMIYLYLWYRYYKINIFKNMIDLKEKSSINFKKAQSLISRIIKMIEEDKYCIDIMQQNLAVIGLLKSAHQMLMENHLNTCFKKAMTTKNEKRKKEMVQEILKVTKLYNNN
jgi:DNA-binding FrmR family transcriptional regulator